MTSPRAVLATVVVVGAIGLGLAFLSSTGRLPPPLAVGVAVAPALAGAPFPVVLARDPGREVLLAP